MLCFVLINSIALSPSYKIIQTQIPNTSCRRVSLFNIALVKKRKKKEAYMARTALSTLLIYQCQIKKKKSTERTDTNNKLKIFKYTMANTSDIRQQATNTDRLLFSS